MITPTDAIASLIFDELDDPWLPQCGESFEVTVTPVAGNGVTHLHAHIDYWAILTDAPPDVARSMKRFRHDLYLFRNIYLSWSLTVMKAEPGEENPAVEAHGADGSERGTPAPRGEGDADGGARRGPDRGCDVG